MAKSKRGKRSKKNKSQNSTVEEIRTCVSGEKLEKSTLSPLHFVDILSPIITPSPKTDRPSDARLVLVQNNSFRPRSRSSVAKLGSPLKLENVYETTKVSLRIDETPIYEYKTPLKRLRSNSFATNFNNSQKFLQSPPDVDSKYYTPNVQEKVNVIHYSTPKTLLFEEKKAPSTSNESRQSLESLRSLSPILKNEQSVKSPKSCIVTRTLSPNKKYLGTFKRYRRFGMHWPWFFADFCSWVGITFKKALTSLKKYYYDTLVVSSPISVDECVRCNCHVKINLLTDKLEAVSTELARVTKELQSFEELKKEFYELKKCIGSGAKVPCAPPAPPPPPPPPPPMPIAPTPLARPSRIAVRKVERQNSQQENSRPLITVNDILNVRLRKTNTTSALISKKPQQMGDELFRQVKLRPPVRHNSPSSSSSPKSSLTRILKNVDTNVRRATVLSSY